MLEQSAKQLLPYSERFKNARFLVERSDNGPIVLYHRGPKGEYLVRLDTKDRYWCQYAFQFSHEIGHVLCGYKQGNQQNLWFEESLCETASLFTLEKLSEAWRRDPPFETWRAYAPQFIDYQRKRLKDLQPPGNFQLASWWRENKNTLSSSPILRKENLWVATRLLPLFQKDPKTGWSACAYLNQTKTASERSFRRYLVDWSTSCSSAKEKNFVKRVAQLFEISIP